MKIFIICNSLGGGGAERVGVNLANGFAKRGHQISIITDVFQPSTYPVEPNVSIIPLCKKGKGKLEKALTVQASKFSKSALEAIKAAGGTAEVI